MEKKMQMLKIFVDVFVMYSRLVSYTVSLRIQICISIFVLIKSDFTETTEPTVSVSNNNGFLAPRNGHKISLT